MPFSSHAAIVPHPSVKVVLCGPPHSGKSCLREGLKQAILPWHRAGKAPYPYVPTVYTQVRLEWI